MLEEKKKQSSAQTPEQNLSKIFSLRKSAKRPTRLAHLTVPASLTPKTFDSDFQSKTLP